MDLVGRHLFFHEMRATVKKFIADCYECQANKTRRHRKHGLLQPLEEPHEVWHTLGMDFVTGVPPTDEGYDAITVLSDKFSKFAFFFRSQKNDDARKTAQSFLHHVFPVTGLPRKLMSDRDARFTSSFWKEMAASLQITRGMSTPYHPQTDGQVERLNETLSSMLRHFVSVRQTDWDSKLPILALAYNNRRHSSMSFSPYELVFGQHPHLLGLDTVPADAPVAHSDWADELRAARQEAGLVIELSAARQKAWFDADRAHSTLEVGDLAWVNAKNYHAPLESDAEARRKLSAKYVGPFPVLEKVGKRAYRLELPGWFRAHDVFPVDALERHEGDPASIQPRPVIGLDSDEDGAAQEEQHVRRFLGRRPSCTRTATASITWSTGWATRRHGNRTLGCNIYGG